MHISDLVLMGGTLIFLTGCGPSGPARAEVNGFIKLNGELVKEGSIQFTPVEGTAGPSAGGIIKDGAYRITRDKGPVVGKNRVELLAFKETGRKVQDPTGKPGALAPERIQVFPAEYNVRPTVVKEVRAGTNTIDFDVITKGR